MPNHRVSVLPLGECKTAKPENESCMWSTVIFGILLVRLKNAPSLLTSIRGLFNTHEFILLET